MPCERATKELDVHAEVYIVGLVMQSPAMYLTELCHNLLNVLGIEVFPSTVCQLLRTYRFSRKQAGGKSKMCYTAGGFHGSM